MTEYIDFIWVTFIPIALQLGAIGYLLTIRKAIGKKFFTLFAIKNTATLLYDIGITWGIMIASATQQREPLESLGWYIGFIFPMVVGACNLLAQRLLAKTYKGIRH
jgi:hypothetical protein